MKKLLIALMLLVATLIGPISASVHAAAISQVTSTVDWNSLSIVMDESGGITWLGRYEASYTNASNNLETNPQLEQVLWNSQTGVSSTNSVLNATGYGYTTTGSVTADAYSRADGIGTTNANASASVHRRDFFTISTDATAVFSLNYSFIHDILVAETSEGGWAYSVASLILLGPNNDFNNPIDYVQFEFNQNTAGYYTESGVLSVSGALLAGESYSIELHIYGANGAYAPQSSAVPEPSTLLLVSLGLVGLAKARKILKK